MTFNYLESDVSVQNLNGFNLYIIATMLEMAFKNILELYHFIIILSQIDKIEMKITLKVKPTIPSLIIIKLYANDTAEC